MRVWPSLLLTVAAATAAGAAPPAPAAACASADEVAAYQAALPTERAAYFKTHRRARDRARFETRQRSRRDALARAALLCASGRQLLPFFPQAGVLDRDLYLTNFVDVQPGPGTLDPFCGQRTYDGHTGIDVVIRSFREQTIGVPVYAALDGQVTSVQDGNRDTSHGRNTLPWDNHVIVNSGNGQRFVYGHLRRGSATPEVGDWVVAGQQIGLTASSGNSSWPHLHFTEFIDDQPYDPWAGPCRPGASGWADQPAVSTAPYVGDVTVGTRAFTGRDDVPWDEAPRTGTFVTGLRDVHVRAALYNADRLGDLAAHVVRPDGSVAADVQPAARGAWRQAWATWHVRLPLGVLGRWTIQLVGDGRTLASAPFDVVASADGVVNRAPHAVAATIVPTTVGARRCVLDQDLAYEDPDYDVVRYRYVWTSAGKVVRAVTSAALSDTLQRTVAGPVTCAVTPSDGRLRAATATATG